MLIFIALAASGFTLIPHGHCRVRIPIRARSSAPALADPAPYEEWLPAPAGESASTTNFSDASAGDWIAAAIITGASEIGRATGLASENATDLEATAVTVGGAAALKVGLGVLAKVTATAATVMVAGPAVKIATTAAGVGQLAYERYKQVKLENEAEEAEAEVERLAAVRDGTLEQADAVSLARKRERKLWRKAATLAKIIERFSIDGPPSRGRLLCGMAIGTVMGALLPFAPWIRASDNPMRATLLKLVEAAIGAILASRSVKAMCSIVNDVKEVKEKDLARAIAKSREAASATAAVMANLTAAQAERERTMTDLAATGGAAWD
jgi:hypothetical protein